MAVIVGYNRQLLAVIVFLGVSNVDTRAIICDPETGEKKGELRTGDRIVRARTKEYMGDTVEILPDEAYIKTFTKPLTQLAETLTGPETSLVYYLVQYLSYESGMLKHRNGQPLDRTYISGETGQSERTVDRLLHGLKAKHVVGRNVVGREVQYFLNPWLFMRGKRINKTLHDMFKNSRWAKVYEIKRVQQNNYSPA
ncbi:MAG: hypothetical protein ACYC4H_00850 [Desulfocucumaceae bacterium]